LIAADHRAAAALLLLAVQQSISCPLGPQAANPPHAAAVVDSWD